MLDLFRFDELTENQRRVLVRKLDRITDRFAYGVIGATVLLFIFHAVRWAIHSGPLS